MIELQNVTKVYGTEVVALDKLTFRVEKGEFVFLTGPSGAGKSTLLRLLLRQELPTEGDAHRRRPQPGGAVDQPGPGLPPRRSASSSRTSS